MKDMLKLIIDGVEFNDVDKMKVTPAYTTSNLPMTFPVKCFLPFESWLWIILVSDSSYYNLNEREQFQKGHDAHE